MGWHRMRMGRMAAIATRDRDVDEDGTLVEKSFYKTRETFVIQEPLSFTITMTLTGSLINTHHVTSLRVTTLHNHSPLVQVGRDHGSVRVAPQVAILSASHISHLTSEKRAPPSTHASILLTHLHGGAPRTPHPNLRRALSRTECRCCRVAWRGSAPTQS